MAELIPGGKFLDRNFREGYRLKFLIELTGSWKGDIFSIVHWSNWPNKSDKKGGIEGVKVTKRNDIIKKGGLICLENYFLF